MLASWTIIANANENNNNNNVSSNLTNEQTLVATQQEEEESYDNTEKTEKFRRGFSSITEVGAIHIGSNTFFTISETWGVRVNPYFFVGQGMHASFTNNKMVDLSATVDVRTNFIKRNISPFLMFGLGINRTNMPIITNEDVLKSGNRFLLNAGAGLEFRITEKAGITLNGGYKLIADKNKPNHGGFVKVGYIF